MQPITIMVVEDNSAKAKQVADLINTQPDMMVVAISDNPKEALSEMERLRPMIVLMDINITPDNRQQGIELALEASLLFEGMKLIILSQTIDEETIYHTIGVGAVFNYVTREHIGLLPPILRYAAEDKLFMEPEVAQLVIQAYQLSVKARMEAAVTDHEMELLECVYEGYSNAEMAEKFNLERQSLTNAKAKIVKKANHHAVWRKSPKKLTAQQVARRYKKAGLFVALFCYLTNQPFPIS